MSGFWQDKINEMRPAQRPQQPQTPASWWQGPRAAQPEVVPRAATPQQERGYAPVEAAHVEAEETCPRCGSEEYAEFPVDLSYGGRGGMSETGFNMSKPKQCFDCRYPSRDPSGDIVKGKGVRIKDTKAKRLDVRQVGDPDVSLSTLFDNAPLIV